MASTRNTVQRHLVEEQLFAPANHPTADQVYEAVRARYPRVGKATVYRVLNKLVDEGVAQRIRLNNGPDCFDHRTDPHYHVRCVECGRVEDVEIPIDDELDVEAGEMTGFTVLGHSLQFDGLCPDCASMREAASK